MLTPRGAYPFYTDEIGRGPGEGYNVNLPVALHSVDATYLEVERLFEYQPRSHGLRQHGHRGNL